MKSSKDFGLTLLRAMVGIVFVAHGYQKFFVWGIGGVTGAFAQMGIPAPHLSAYLAASAEFFGGLFLLLGLLTRLAAIPVAITMIVAILQVHLKGGFFAPQGVEYPLTLLVANIALIVAGGGALALDNVIFRHSRKQSRLASEGMAA